MTEPITLNSAMDFDFRPFTKEDRLTYGGVGDNAYILEDTEDADRDFKTELPVVIVSDGAIGVVTAENEYHLPVTTKNAPAQRRAFLLGSAVMGYLANNEYDLKDLLGFGFIQIR